MTTGTTIDPHLDHLVYAVPDLLAGVAEFAERTGVTPVAGGSHPGGTANHLVGLGPSSYLEIIGPDPAAGPDARPRAFGLDSLREPRLAAWAVHPGDIDAAVRRARERGHDPGDVQPLSRRTPGGTLLEWRLTRRDDPAAVRPVPFLIDWGRTPHPAASGLPELRLDSFAAAHPDPAGLRRDLAALDVRLDVADGPEPALRAVLLTPLGPVTLT
ncbi:VOC family protein [Streptosporangium sandarakinum]